MAKPPALKAPASKPSLDEHRFHVVQKVISGETYMVMQDTAIALEDEFSNLYYTASEQSKVVLMPPFNVKELMKQVTHNNILAQCVEAMEVNIDGSGHEFVPKDEDTKEDAAEKQMLTDFFNEPYPGMSFITMRRNLRRDMESCGYAALEVLKNLGGEVVALRQLESHNLRLVKLTDPIMVTKTINRNGKEVQMQYLDRERRFMQRLGNRYIYYKAFGGSQDVNKDTGEWSKAGTLPPEKRASELLFFGVLPDISTPYFVPRWINNLPAVVGSRKAEEQNLEYFDAGGLPPAIIFIQGGTLAKDAADQLRNYMSGKNKSKHRAVVVEAQSSSGSLDSSGTVQVKVERFGSERIQDPLFATYDKNSEEHVRTAFRLPPLFLGRAADYNYATAVVAYMVAEQQVFQPERTSFDEKINKTIVDALGAKSMVFKSKGVTLKNIDASLAALTIAAPLAKVSDVLDEVNKLTDMHLTAAPKEKPVAPPLQLDANGQPIPPVAGQPPVDPNADPAKQPAKTVGKPGAKLKVVPKSAAEIVELAQCYAQSKNLIASKSEASEDDLVVLRKAVDELSGQDLMQFNELVAAYAFGSTEKSMISLAACAHGH
jgi:PBSX family phage portal protein